MPKYKPYNYSQGVLLPVYLDTQIMPGTLEFAIHTLVENHLDMSVFDQKYNNDANGPAVNLSKRMQEKIDNDQGRRIYEQRLGMIEPVFANIRTHKRLDRFSLRGKIKVNIQWLLYCMVHNIEKIMNYAPA